MALMAQTGFALSTEDGMRLLVSALMVLAGFIPLVTPLHHLGMPRRPWALIVLMLSTGLLGAAGPLSRGIGLGLWVEVASVAAQIAIFAAFIGTAIWLRRRAKQHRTVPAKEIRLSDELWASDVKALLMAGDKIGAIRLVRERTGAGLAEAKRAVDELR